MRSSSILDRVARDPWIDPEFDIADAFVERAMGEDVAAVVIGGKIVVENHQPRTLDVEGLYRRCARSVRRAHSRERARADCSRKINPMSRHGTAPGRRHARQRSIGSIAEHRSFAAIGVETR